VRWHLRCIYSKLGVHNRTALVALLNSADWMCNNLCASDAV
jgi:DNA-binding CsgD family transcriptional regulator